MTTLSTRYQVTEKDVAEYWDRGYWITPKLLTDVRIDRLRQALEMIFRGEVDGDGYFYDNEFVSLSKEPQALRKVTNGWWVNDDVRDLVLDPELGRIAAALMKTVEVRLWHDQIVWKPGAGGQSLTNTGNVGWHQDYAYWNCTTTTNMVTAWIALQDTDLANGAISTLVGSHKRGLVEDADTFYIQNLEELRRRFAGRLDMEWIEEPCVLKAGQVSFHHALCFHGSGPNATSEPRLSVIAHYMPRDCGYRKGGRYHRNVRFLGPRPRDGQLFANEYFPRVFPGSEVTAS